jgi:hypothetical protein
MAVKDASVIGREFHDAVGAYCSLAEGNGYQVSYVECGVSIASS